MAAFALGKLSDTLKTLMNPGNGKRHIRHGERRIACDNVPGSGSISLADNHLSSAECLLLVDAHSIHFGGLA